MPDRIARVAGLFDAVAPTYDQVGVDFFQPIAHHLVGLLDPRPGESVVELGCGRGALTLPLAEAVGTDGSVRACDISPAMVDLTSGLTADLRQVNVSLMNAAEPTYEPRSVDVVAASLVLFFLPDPPEALRRWVDLLVPGGRIGLTTFGAQDEVWSGLDELFDPYLPPDVLDARTTGKRGPFASDTAFEQLLTDSGAADVRSVTQPVTISLADSAAWQRWSMSVGQRMMWTFVPDDDLPGLLARADALLDGVPSLRQDVRHTLGRTPD